MQISRMRRASALLLVAVLGACADGARSEPTVPSGSVAAPTEVAVPALAVTGRTETVFDWTSDRCATDDIPDVAARAFRDATGRVQVIASHYENRRFVGATLDDIRRECRIIMRSSMQADPAAYSDRAWLSAPYTEDGKTIVALVHHEYQGHQHPNRCPPAEYYPCWYNSITLAISTDSGRAYEPAAAPPRHFVAGLPHRYEPGAGPYGIFEPSNIIKGRDGGYYAFVRVDEHRSDEQRICLMRTSTLRDPASWRAWDGSDFSVAFIDPHRREPAGRSEPACAAISPGELGVMASSVTYNTYLDRYVMVGVTAIHAGGREVWGVLYAFSDDLITWQPRQLLFEVELPWTYRPGDDNVYLYPALLDPASPSRNFETTGKTAYLYLTRFNARGAGDTLDTLDRDLVRVPVEFFPSAEEAASAAVPFLG